MSARTATSKTEAELRRREPSEPELLPERSLVEARPTGDATLLSTQPVVPMEQLLQHLGGMVQQALREQVTPKLQEMIAQQSMVSVRLDQLERASRSASLDGELLAERTSLLDLSGPQASEPLRASAVDSVPDNQALSRSVHSTAQQQAIQVRATPNPEEGRLQRLGGKSEAKGQSNSRNSVDGGISVRMACGCWRIKFGTSSKSSCGSFSWIQPFER